MVLWDVALRAERARFSSHAGPVRTVAFSRDGKILASGGEDGLIKLWNVESGKEVATLQGHEGIVFAVAFGADGNTLASTGLDRTVRLWRLGNLLWTPPDLN